LPAINTEVSMERMNAAAAMPNTARASNEITITMPR
jgi:hypothetical protein